MSILEIQNVEKKYTTGTHALRGVSLSIQKGEIFALLGPNGAGKTTLIGIICGTVQKTGGTVQVAGYDIEIDWRKTRSLIGYVPQELTLNPFDTVWDTLSFQRGFYGRPKNDALLESILRNLSLWEKKGSMIRELSGGMKRRVLIGKALTNEPEILFLDEPTAGVDVELRKGMWDFILTLKSQGVTIVLTTHYLEEAELLADRIGIIRNGSLIHTEKTQDMLERFGEKTLVFSLSRSLDTIPTSLHSFHLTLSEEKNILTFPHSKGETDIAGLIDALKKENIHYTDISTKTKSLEDIFLQLIEDKNLV